MILPPFNLPEGIILLITDELGAPGNFLLHRALAQHLKTDKTALVLSVSESLARWKALATKSVRNMINIPCTGRDLTQVTEYKLGTTAEEGSLDVY